jgi:hypothetical protein
LETVVEEVEVVTDIADLGRKGDEAKLDADVNAGVGEFLTRLRSALRDWHSWAFWEYWVRKLRNSASSLL